MNTHGLIKLVLIAGACSPIAPVVTASSGSPDPVGSGEDLDLTELSLEELMAIELTIATRTEEPMSEIPAAVYVLTGDEIRRSGHTSIPEALRMVPGLHVSRWTTNAWDVTSRGFGPGLSFVSEAYLNQLLVMVDGVVVYTPLYAGVWWPLQDIPLESIDRIEIVRGPGGMMWGTNAVHGVVHVITKKAEETQGVQVDLRYGTDDRHGSVRYGGKIGEDTYYRAWFKGASYDTLHEPFLGFDYDWGIVSGGARVDFKAFDKEFNTWARVYTSEFYDVGADLVTWESIQVRDEKKGAQIYASMSDPDLNDRWQAWFSSDQQDQKTLLDIDIEEFDLEYSRALETSKSNKLNLGAGYRSTHSTLHGYDPFWMTFAPETRHIDRFRIFALDTWSLNSLNTSLTAGVTLEHNGFTGWEVQPTVRAAWSPKDDLMFWGGVSRAVRTPSLEERDLSEDSYFVGDPNFRSEEMLAYEIGGRTIPTEWFSADLALYYNDYDNLHYLDGDALPWGYQITNEATGKSYGAELALDFRVSDVWKIRTGYTYHYGSYVNSNGEPLATDLYHPKNIFNVRSYYDLGKKWELDLGFYGVQDLGEWWEIAEYYRIDARLGWKPCSDFEVYIGGQGMHEPYRSELHEFDLVRRAFYIGMRFGS